MQRAVIFYDRQTVTEADLNNLHGFARSALDNIALDAIERGRRFTGFTVTEETSTAVNVQAGRLWYNGRVHYRDDADGVDIDLLALKPAINRKVVAIVASAETVEVDEQERDFEIDAENQVYEADTVAVESRRRARLEAIGGAEAVLPQPPAVDAGGVVVALITMDAAGIVEIVRNTAAELRNLSDVAGDVDGLLAFADETGPQMSTLRSDLARLSAEAEANGNKELLLQIAGDVAGIKARLDIPDTYVGYRALPFLDLSKSDTGAAGYAARIEEGLRFPFAASETSELALLNPNQPQARVSAGGLLLPAYTKAERRITKGDNGALSLADYSAQEARTLVKLQMSPSRIRFGGDFEVTVGSAWWNAGTYAGRLNDGIRGVFQKAGEEFQVYETGKVDQDGHKIVRLAKFWTDDVAKPYWSRLVTEDEKLGYAHVETFLNAQDRWVVGLGPHLKAKPANGSITVGICETYRGEPDLSRVVALTTVNAADVQLVGAAGGFPEIAIEPTFLKGGERYGYFIVTQHNFQIGVSDAAGADSAGATGQYFYGLNGGTWFAEPTVHLLWRDFTAVFPKSRVDIDLQGLQLAGGIQAIDVLADAVIPGSTDLVFSVLIGGVWRPLDPSDPDVLSTLPALAPFRATFVGTPDVMPGLQLDGSQAIVSRLAEAAKHVSDENTVASSDQVVMTIRMRGFDPAHHTVVMTVDRGPGTIETHDSLVTINHPDGVVEKIATFTLGAAMTAYQGVIQMTTDHVSRPFTVIEAIEITDT
ncbi:MAG: hypothetical protein U1C74_09005 [Phenylobacterium sp.]|nr:hypothetical protein [Phenylobacterium sp.]